jgi:toxic protein SymE
MKIDLLCLQQICSQKIYFMHQQAKVRKVKLHSKYRAVNGGWINSGYQAIPWLNVSGQWLERAGFKAGDPVEITIENNTLTIKNMATDGHP